MILSDFSITILGETGAFVWNDILGDFSMGFLADSTLHNTEPEFAYSALAPHLADTSPPDCHHATANWAD